MAASSSIPGRAVLGATALFLAAACQSGGEHGVPDAHGTAKVHVLFDGGSTDGWKMAGPGAFVLEDGAIKATGGMGLLWYADKEFEDFALQLEFQVEDAADNSGVFVRFPDPGDDPWIAVNQGYEIQICDTAPEKHDTGSIYSFQGSTAKPTKPAGEWNVYRITAIGNSYQVELNGEVVNVFGGERGTRGYVGLQNHDDGSPVRFRNITVTEL
jgi:hypothetical protein